MTLPKLQMTLVSPSKVGLAIRSTSAIAHGKWKITTPAYYTNTVWVQEFERDDIKPTPFFTKLCALFKPSYVVFLGRD